MKLILSFIFAILILTTAYSQPCKGFEGNKKKVDFKILRKIPPKFDSIHIQKNSVYLYTFVTPGENDRYYFMKFFDSGRVFISEIYCSIPNDTELSNLSYGRYGHFLLSGNQMTIEMHGPYVGYYFRYGIIQNGDIMFNATALRKFYGRSKKKQEWPSKYIYYKINNSTHPFW